MVQQHVEMQTYDCRVKTQIIYETNMLRELFNGIHEKFLKAIDHMEFHPTLGKEKKGTSYKLHKCSTENRNASMADQMKYLSPDGIEMLRQKKQNNPEKIFECEQHEVLNKDIWFGYLDFGLGNI